MGSQGQLRSNDCKATPTLLLLLCCCVFVAVVAAAKPRLPTGVTMMMVMVNIVMLFSKLLPITSRYLPLPHATGALPNSTSPRSRPLNLPTRVWHRPSTSLAGSRSRMGST